VETDRTIPNNKPDIKIRDNEKWTLKVYSLMYLTFVFYIPEDGHMLGRNM
jgi:hypothetical protein